MSAAAPISLGFGSYALPPGKTFAQFQLCAKVEHIFRTVIFALLAVLSLMLPLPIAAVGTLLFSYQAAKAALRAIGCCFQAEPTHDPQEAPPVALGQSSPCSGFATRDSAESHEWKLRLIRAAKSSILLSGCYCGGKAFDETLDLIRERMSLVPALTAAILASNVFITPTNIQRLQAMEQTFGPRFRFALTPELFPYTSPTTNRFSLTTNHTKALVIDSGAAFLLGGSGIVTPWSHQKGEAAARPLESHGFLYDTFMKVWAYRDMDFVFQSLEQNGAGARLHVEMAKLFERFHSGKGAPIAHEPACTEPISLPRALPDLKISLYASGPEHPTTDFLNALIAKVERAQKSIFIGHMYFHPTPPLQQALIDASNRGVEITLLTNRWGSRSPGSHAAYATLSRCFAKSLFEGRQKPNIVLYEYDIPHTTYHKKAIVIDSSTTFGGSSNLGQKSLDADYEINFQVESAPFAAAVAQSLEGDKLLCRKDQDPHIPLKTRLLASLQSLFTPFL